MKKIKKRKATIIKKNKTEINDKNNRVKKLGKNPAIYIHKMYKNNQKPCLII